ncbi:MAG: LysO family transporter [Prevotellaceae bacterium]|jgi:uncharacterized membrane protein YbjE (DUF340 family)|nr:LysO family transporter [Prevotellaceae bacterium]
MLEIIGIMIIGCAAGYIFKSQNKFIRVAERLCSLVIFLLLFSLGLSVGKNDAVMKNISNLGLLSVGIAIAAVAGSVVCAWFLYKIFFRKIKPD